eukprot:XP_011508272.2 uridine-cytidine kinase 2 isoform X2 [Homo sapiens]
MFTISACPRLPNHVGWVDEVMHISALLIRKSSSRELRIDLWPLCWFGVEPDQTDVGILYFLTNAFSKEETVTVYPADVVLFEGILAFYSQEVRDLFQMKLFVDTDADTRLSRRVLRDISERGRDLEQILSQYITFVKPAFEEFCLPTKKYADVIIPRGADNLVAINLIVQHIQDILNGGPSKRQTNGCLNGYTPSRKRQASESSSRPH